MKTYGNIVAFRNLEDETNKALELFGNKDAHGVVLLKPFGEYYSEYAENVSELLQDFPLHEQIVGEAAQKRFIELFGKILQLENILTSFDDFTGADMLTERQGQDYRSTYLDLYAEFRQERGGEKELINDDVVFEIELIKQVEINVDYILMLVTRYQQAHGDGEDKEVLAEINRAVEASPTLRNKKDLIVDFVDMVSMDVQVSDQWSEFVHERKDHELSQIITDERLRAAEAREFVERSFERGGVREGGTELSQILPPTRRFGQKSGDYSAKRRRVLDRLQAFLERFSAL